MGAARSAGSRPCAGRRRAGPLASRPGIDTEGACRPKTRKTSRQTVNTQPPSRLQVVPLLRESAAALLAPPLAYTRDVPARRRPPPSALLRLALLLCFLCHGRAQGHRHPVVRERAAAAATPGPAASRRHPDEGGAGRTAQAAGTAGDAVCTAAGRWWLQTRATWSAQPVLRCRVQVCVYGIKVIIISHTVLRFFLAMFLSP